MNTTFYDSKYPPIKINGKQILIQKSSRTHSHTHSSSFHLSTQETPKTNTSFSIHKQVFMPQRFSLEKDKNFNLKPFSPIIQHKVNIIFSPSCGQKYKPFLSLEQTRPQSVKQHYFKQTNLFDTTKTLNFDFIKTFDKQPTRFINRQSLRPSNKPRLISSTVNKCDINIMGTNTGLNQKTRQNENELTKYLPINSIIFQRKPLSIENSLFIKDSMVLLKEKQVKSFELTQKSLRQSKNNQLKQIQQKYLTKSQQAQKYQRFKSNKFDDNNNYQYKKQQIFLQKPSLLKQKIKTSFDKQVPQLFSNKQSQQQSKQKSQNIQQNQQQKFLFNQQSNQQIFKKVIAVKKINSLFTPLYNQNSSQLQSSSFDFSNSNINNKDYIENYATQSKPKRKRKYTVYSKHYSQSQQQLENYDFCTYLESQLNKDHNKTNSSFSLEQVDPLYQQQRQIMIKYLQFMHKERKKSNKSQNSKHPLSNQELNQSLTSISFIDFVNQLYELQESKYPPQKQLQPTYGFQNIFKNTYHINVHYHHHHHGDPKSTHHYQSYLLKGPSHHHHHHQHRHHSHHLPFHHHNKHDIQMQFNQSTKPQIHHLINIGQNSQQIKNNRMIIHVISIWLMEMGFLKEQNKQKVVENIKKLFMSAFQNIELDQMLLDDVQKSYIPNVNINNQVENFVSTNQGFGNIFQTQSSSYMHNYNSGLKSNLKHSILQNQPTSRSTPQYKMFGSHIESNKNQCTLQNTISSIYTKMYHKILPVNLQLLVLLNICKRGWNFFEFLTVKVLKIIYFYDEKSNKRRQSQILNNNKQQSLNKKLDKMIRKMIRKMIND